MSEKLPQHNYAVIMAGGSGTRLWPLSRKDLPKQMQKFVSDKTLINETVERLMGFIKPENVYISTTANYEEKIRSLLPEIPGKNIVVEPIARGTTAALALVTTTIYQRDPEARLFYIASDHAVTDVEKFQRTLLDTFNYIAQNPKDIALVGIKPTRPDTGLGYIKMSEKISDEPEVHLVDKFVEKPSLKVAKLYVNSGEYYWNAAYYCFSAKTLLEAYEDADPELTSNVEAYIRSNDIEDFNKVPVKAQEIEVIDASKYRLVLVPADFSWSDIGNWQALHELLASIEGTNLIAHSSKHIDINSSNCLVMSTSEKLIATVGLDNLVVVDTPDVTLILNKEQPQEIKQLLEILKEKGMTEYL
jgi:mannose-1-phosphate guanylyltransferase/mannose-6-phosphate isomerase